MTSYDKLHGLVNSLTLEMVLNDETPSPYSLKEFIKYLKQTYCTENLEFYRDVADYKSVCYSFFGPLLLKEQQEDEEEEIGGGGGVKLSNGRLFYFRKDQEHWLNNKEKVFFHHLIIKFNMIMENYIFFNAMKEINIPSDLKQQLLHSFSKQHYHPHLLQPAYSSILELLRISAFIPFITDANRFPLSPSSSTSSSSSSSSSCNNYMNELNTSTAAISMSNNNTLSILENNNHHHHHYNDNKYVHNNSHIEPTSSSVISTSSVQSSTSSSHHHPHLPWNPRRLKSSPSLNTSSLSTCTTLHSESPPLPKSSLSSSTKNKEDTASIYSYKSNRLLRLPSPTSPTSEQSTFFIKKVISSTLKIRPNPSSSSSSSSSPNNNNNNTNSSSKPPTRPTGGWKRINIPDPSIFQQLPKAASNTTTNTTMTSNNNNGITTSSNISLN